MVIRLRLTTDRVSHKMIAEMVLRSDESNLIPNVGDHIVHAEKRFAISQRAYEFANGELTIHLEGRFLQTCGHYYFRSFQI